MLFSKLLPKEGNFFELFNQHADRIVEAALAFEKLVDNYSDVEVRNRYAQEVDNAERAASAAVSAVTVLDRSGSMISSASVSYTHLTLPTSDLV